ncbi:unnamed protein product, partial [marine sediment metagenome]
PQRGIVPRTKNRTPKRDHLYLKGLSAIIP